MASQEYVARVKRDLRRTTSEFDADIDLLISEAQQDLQLRGIPEYKTTDESDVTVFRFIALYCHLNFGILSPEEYRKFSEALDSHRRFLMFAEGGRRGCR